MELFGGLDRMVDGRPVTVVDDSEPVNTVDISTLTDEEVWRRFLELAAEERVLISDLVACLAEVDARMLVRDRHWPSLFDYCVFSLHWSESAAYRRIRAARAVRKFPMILEMLRDGRLHLEGVVILHAFIDDADFASLLLKAVGMTTKSIESLVADRRRDPPVRDSMRFVGISAPPSRLPSRRRRSNFLRTPRRRPRVRRSSPRRHRRHRRRRSWCASASPRTKAFIAWCFTPSSSCATNTRTEASKGSSETRCDF